MFELHPQLAKDCIELGNFPLSRALLLNDSHYPWVILVPRRINIREVFELDVADQRQLLIESSALSEMMAADFNADKMNIAALGNMVPQLHIHHIVRYETDLAWPNPVWGAVAAVPYNKDKLAVLLQNLRQLLSEKGLDY
jgi:diadenosine tetraphosphate (Ap4A) HIT family hydrolase